VHWAKTAGWPSSASSKRIWRSPSSTLPVLLGMIGDWIENVIQLGQLQRYIDSGKSALDPGPFFGAVLQQTSS